MQFIDLDHGGRFDAGDKIDADSHPFSREAMERLDMSLKFLETAFGRTGIQDFECCIQWGSGLANAMWSNGRLLLGDGDDCHRPYSQSLSIVMHELTHSLVEMHGLSNADESKAVNEHLCDVFGILMKQWLQTMSGEETDWLFGSEVRICTDTGAAIRNMLDPSSNARDEGAMVWSDAAQNPADVYYNAGVLNHAFALATESIDALPWKSTGLVWYRALDSLPWSTDIPEFARLVVANAGEYDAEIAAAFRQVDLAI